MNTDVNSEWYSIYEGEGITIEEAKLSYAERKDLPSGAFCGPDRSFPAHDAKHVRNGLARLKRSKFSTAVKAKILACLRRRAKKYNIEVSETVTTEESYNPDTVRWYLESLGIKA